MTTEQPIVRKGFTETSFVSKYLQSLPPQQQQAQFQQRQPSSISPKSSGNTSKPSTIPTTLKSSGTISSRTSYTLKSSGTTPKPSATTTPPSYVTNSALKSSSSSSAPRFSFQSNMPAKPIASTNKPLPKPPPPVSQIKPSPSKIPTPSSKPIVTPIKPSNSSVPPKPATPFSSSSQSIPSFKPTATSKIPVSASKSYQPLPTPKSTSANSSSPTVSARISAYQSITETASKPPSPSPSSSPSSPSPSKFTAARPSSPARTSNSPLASARWSSGKASSPSSPRSSTAAPSPSHATSIRKSGQFSSAAPSPLRTSTTKLTQPSPSSPRATQSFSPPSPRSLRSSGSFSKPPSSLRLSSSRIANNGLSTSQSSLRSSSSQVNPTNSSSNPVRYSYKQNSQTKLNTSSSSITTPNNRGRSTPTGIRLRSNSKTDLPPPLPKRLSANTLLRIKIRRMGRMRNSSNSPSSPRINTSTEKITRFNDKDEDKSSKSLKKSSELVLSPPLLPPKRNRSFISFSLSVDGNITTTTSINSPPLNNSFMSPPLSPPLSSPLPTPLILKLSSESSIVAPDSPNTARRKSNLLRLSAHTKKFKKIKVTIIGEPGIGKSNLISSLLSHTFTEEYVPTIFQTHNFLTKFGPWGIQLSIWEMSCAEKYVGKRPVCYPETGIFIICFDLSQPHTFQLAKEKWLEELQTHGYGNTPKIFVGLKQDLSLGVQAEITHNYSHQNLGEQFMICECSSKKGEGIDEVFEEAIRKYLYYDQENEALHWRDVRVFATATTQKISHLLSL